MWADILKKAPTEIDFINGYIVKKAKETGLQASRNELLVSLVHMKEHWRLC